MNKLHESLKASANELTLDAAKSHIEYLQKERIKFKESVIIKLTMLIGACRTRSIAKKQIEDSIERYIKELGDM